MPGLATVSFGDSQDDEAKAALFQPDNTILVTGTSQATSQRYLWPVSLGLARWLDLKLRTSRAAQELLTLPGITEQTTYRSAPWRSRAPARSFWPALSTTNSCSSA